MNVLANDGISQTGIDSLESSGFKVITTTVAQEQLINYINEHTIDVILVRSATKVRKDIIDSCPSLKIIGRGGVGMDNIDVEYARSKNLKVINTPAASSASVAELVFAHLFGGVRFLYDANRNMPLSGDSKFKELNLVKIFILPTDLGTLKTRLVQRNQDNINSVEKRLKSFEEDRMHWKDYDYVLINDNLENCFSQIEKIINNSKNLPIF